VKAGGNGEEPLLEVGYYSYQAKPSALFSVDKNASAFSWKDKQENTVW